MKLKLSLSISILVCIVINTYAQGDKLLSIKERVNVQADSAKVNQIIDNEWVAVGTNKPHSKMYDYNIPFDGKPSYRFELKEEDNTLSGYAKGETKGRAELSYCYATHSDFVGLQDKIFQNAQKMKTVYHFGKGICPQGASRNYTFSVYIPSSLNSDVSTIFAQWHGMPDRTLVSTPEGEVKKLSTDQFLDLYERMIFKKNVAHEKIEKKDKNGNITYKTGKETGWLVEQGGYPPLAFGFSNAHFYIKANSDRKWLSDKTDRCNANVQTATIMKPIASEFKSSTIAYKLPFDEFPKDCWVTFNVNISWTKYAKEKETIIAPGSLDVMMSYSENKARVNKHIVKNEEILIGRNDEDGYYFKFGIYRVGNSTIPVCYNLAGYEEK